MLRTAIRNLLSHKLRLLLSGLAVVLGVAFISGTMTFTDTLHRTFTGLFEDAAADVNVEPASAFGAGMTGTGIDSALSSVPADLVEEVGAVDGVAAAEGYVEAEGVYVLDAGGDVADTGGAPGIGISWPGDDALSAVTLADGRAPASAGEVALDSATAEELGHRVGDKITVLTTGPRVEAELVGTFRFGEDGGLAGASMTAFDPATAQSLLLEDGRFTGISVAAEDGVTHAELADRIEAVVGDDYDVATRAEQAADQAAALEDQLSFIDTFLLVFAGVALFVGSFIILNTFSMLVAQRTRELALLRALGAGRRQITASVLVEALVLGLLGSTAGLVTGFGLAQGLKALFGQLGVTLDGGLVLSAGTVTWSYVVGVGITLLAAYLPARRAAKVAPVAAMRADLVRTARPLLVRTVVGTVLAATGLAALAAGSLGDGVGGLVGLGALALLVGVITLSPVLAVPFIRLVGAVLPRLAGRTGHLARENALRNPRRTAATSSALMVGLALVTGFSIIGASARASIDELVDDVLEADYVVSTSVGQPFTAAVAEELAQVDGVASVTQERYGTARFDGEESFFVAYEPDALADALEVTFVDGAVEGLAGEGLLVSDETAETQGLAVGDQVEFLVQNGESRELRVGGVFEDNSALGPYLVSMDTYSATGGAPLDRYVYVGVEDGVDASAVEAGIEDVVATYPVVELKDIEGFKDEQRGSIDQMLMLINALLALSVLIAVLGVVNTLVLSVIERTRELGLLRALGMSRRQVRRLVRLESVVISVYGAALGLGLGGVLGLALTRFLRSQGLTVTAVPGGQLALFLVLGAVIGVVAAAFPARRAGRLNVLDAIATD
ncbi:ABC transporter permease [Nocardioides caldifontis]|uniref:ABC transporter permease n=1 Tax=Nocardioides caldifontis TaxID=2588938 RepID=UPI0011DF67DA|nr:FtsX-like permease family protein [Nocardioides caldifontis]